MENEKNTAQEILQEELAAIYIGNLNTVDEDLILPGFIDMHAHIWAPPDAASPGNPGRRDLSSRTERYIVPCTEWEAARSFLL